MSKPPMSNKQILLITVDLIATRGLAHSTLEDSSGCLCIIGAFIKVGNPEAVLIDTTEYEEALESAGTIDAASVLLGYINRNGLSARSLAFPSCLWVWNDGDRPGAKPPQTKESAIAVLQACAAEL